MRLVVNSEAVIHDVFGCLFPNCAFSTDGVYCAPYFVQPILQFGAMATFQLSYRHQLFPGQLRLFSAVKLFSFRATLPTNSFMGYFSHSGSMPDGGLRDVLVVSDAFLIDCSSITGLFDCHLITHYPAVAWAPGEYYLVHFVMEGK